MIAINGTFMCRRITGVERYASRLLLNALELSGGDRQFRLYLPYDPLDQTLFQRMLQAGAEAVIAPRWASNRQVFEQIALPMMAYGDGAEIIVNLTNSLCIMSPTSQLTCLHDAAPFRFPESYRSSYRLKTKAVFTRARRARSVHVFTVSQFSKLELSAFGLSTDAVCMAGPGMEAPPSSLAFDRPRRHFLVYGTLDPRKRVSELVAWWQSPALSRYELHTVGGGSEAHANRNSAAARASVGYLSDEDLLEEILSSFAVIFPSVYEGGAMAPLEVLQLGIPVVCRDIPAYREYLGSQAIYFRNQLELIDAVTAAASSPQVAAKPQLVHSAWTDTANRFLQLIEDII